MSEIDQLRREVLRLEAILDEHGIDHEPEQFGPPGRPMMGPPTLMEHSTQVVVGRWMRLVAAQLSKDVKDFGGTVWPGGPLVKDGGTLRVRAPVNFTVRQ
jgi:hypothetical protein